MHRYGHKSVQKEVNAMKRIKVKVNRNGAEQVIGSISPNSRNEISSRRLSKLLRQNSDIARNQMHTDYRDVKVIDKLGIVAYL